MLCMCGVYVCMTRGGQVDVVNAFVVVRLKRIDRRLGYNVMNVLIRTLRGSQCCKYPNSHIINGRYPNTNNVNCNR